MIKRHRTKPVEIEAVQWTGDNFKEVIEFSELVNIKELILGDYICMNNEGEIFILSSETFNNRYEEIKPPKFQVEYAECNICENYQPTLYLEYNNCLAKENTALYEGSKQDERIHCDKFKTKEGYKMEWLT